MQAGRQVVRIFMGDINCNDNDKNDNDDDNDNNGKSMTIIYNSKIQYELHAQN